MLRAFCSISKIQIDCFYYPRSLFHSTEVYRYSYPYLDLDNSDITILHKKIDKCYFFLYEKFAIVRFLNFSFLSSRLKINQKHIEFIDE